MLDATEEADDEMDEKLFIRISNHFTDFHDCTVLAVFLELHGGKGVVKSLMASNPRITPREVAFEVLCQWKKEKGRAATGAVLHHVLKVDLNWEDLASQFREVLCRKGTVYA